MSNKPNVSTDPAVTSDAQIIEILREHAGLNPEEGTSRKALLKLCRDNEIAVDEAQAGTADAALKPAKAGKTEKAPVGYRINIASSRGKQQVVVGVNGVITIVKCDVDVTVKPGVLEALRNARHDTFDQIRDDLGRVIDTVRRSVPVHAVSVLGPVY